MVQSRSRAAKLNISTSLITQIVTLVCGFMIPRIMINCYGSEAYGATASITQFLGYIAILEGGVGSVARAALYRPLANNDINQMSSVVNEVKRFFRIIAYIFLIYVLVLAVSFKFISDVQSMDWFFTFCLVIAISISTFAQYFIGLSYAVFLMAAQKYYVTNLANIITTILNTAMVILLVFQGCNLVIVKFATSCVFVLRPLIFLWYVKRKYELKSNAKRSNLLSQKWTALGQHIAFFLHSNTAGIILTIFTDLSTVAVYSIYSMIVSNLQNIALSFTNGMESVFGDMLARKEIDNLNRTFDLYETLISITSIILFSITGVMIIPFVKIYTSGIEDANYIVPFFSVLLVAESLCYCLRMPYHALVTAAGKFKDTKTAAYGEVIINIVISVGMVYKFGLIGVAIGRLSGSMFRFIYYVVYISKHLVARNIILFARRFIVNAFNFILVFFTGYNIIRLVDIDDYLKWGMCSCFIALVSVIITVFINYLAYRTTLKTALRRIIRR